MGREKGVYMTRKQAKATTATATSTTTNNTYKKSGDDDDDDDNQRNKSTNEDLGDSISRKLTPIPTNYAANMLLMLLKYLAVSSWLVELPTLP